MCIIAGRYSKVITYSQLRYYYYSDTPYMYKVSVRLIMVYMYIFVMLSW